MPYVDVEVWVDQPECDGACDHVKKAEETIKEAIIMLECGCIEEALELLRREKPSSREKRIKDIKHRYSLIKAGNLPGWTLA